MNTTVSIVEDDRTTRDSLARLIDAAPSLRFVATFGNAEAALRSVPLDPPNVLLVDLRLPGLSGIECVRQLKKLRVPTKLVILTRFSESDEIFEALQAGADGYVLKHKGSEEIIQGIIDVVQDRLTMSSEVAQRVLSYFQKLGRNQDEIQQLSSREREVLAHLAKGWSDKEIAAKLGISGKTVNDHLKSIYLKLQVHSRSAAIAKYLSR